MHIPMLPDGLEIPLTQGITGCLSASPAANKIGIQWLQNALNQYQNAGLSLDGSDGRTKVVRAFQQNTGLSVDGDAGVDTIR